MRVVYVSTIERGGPLTHLRQLVPRVAALGVDVEVLCGSEELAESFRRLDVPARAVEVSHKLDVRGATRLLPLVEGADIVHTHDRRAGLFGRLAGVSNPKEAAHSALERVGLARVKEGLAREFSRGMRQRLAIARAFLHNPELLLLDEPFTSLDDRAIAVLQKLLSEAQGRGSTIIMSTHQLREAMELSTRVALLNRGKLLFQGPRPAEMLQDPTWLYRTYGEG